MILAAFSSKWKSKLAYILQSSTTNNYKIVLNNYLSPSWKTIGGKMNTFMQDKI